MSATPQSLRRADVDYPDARSRADLKIGVVPVINLEWIQKIHREKEQRGYSEGAIVDTILRRMPDYVHFICPQFTETDINFRRRTSRWSSFAFAIHAASISPTSSP